MPPLPVLSVVLPARNEAPVIGRTVPRVARYLDGLGLDYELLVGDSASTDGTGDAVRGLELEGVRVIRDELPGKGRILSRCLREARGRYVGFLDADLEIPEATLGALLERVHLGADAAVAVKDEGRSGRPLHRRLMSRVLNVLLRGLFGTGVSDHQAGCKIFRAGALATVLPRVRSPGWMWDTEVLVLLRRIGCRVDQVPVVASATRPSRVGPVNTLRSVAELVGLGLRTLPRPRLPSGTPRRRTVVPWAR